MLERTRDRDPSCKIIAMIHVGALPGSPAQSEPLSKTVEQARKEALIFADGGVDGIMIENMHDRPYLKGRVGPEVTAAMTMLGREVKEVSGLPTGIQVLAAANREALAVALAAGLDFVRVEGFVFSHVADEGWIDGCAGELLRYRRQIGAEHVAVYTDIKKKHSSHAVTADVDLEETARAAEFFLSDGLIVTGVSTGAEANLDEISRVREATGLPVLVGSGVTPGNVNRYATVADALIVGSSLKRDAHWTNEVDEERVKALMNARTGG